MSILLKRHNDPDERYEVILNIEISLVQSFLYKEYSIESLKSRNERYYFCRENCQIHKPGCLAGGLFCHRPSVCSFLARIPMIVLLRCSLPLSVKI